MTIIATGGADSIGFDLIFHKPETMFAEGSQSATKWYPENRGWWETITSGKYQNWYIKRYADR